jgi:hypothetical protein
MKKYLKSYKTTSYEEEGILVDEENVEVEQACRPIFGREKKNNIVPRTRV